MGATSTQYELRVEMLNQQDRFAVAHYDSFKIETSTASDGKLDYKLRVSGYRMVDGEQSAGDSLSRFDGALFSSYDRWRVSSYCKSLSGGMPGWYSKEALKYFLPVSKTPVYK